MKREEELQEYWDSIHASRIPGQQQDPPSRDRRRKLDSIVIDLNLLNAKILDLGGGTGSTIENFGSTNELYIGDISRIALKKASQKGMKTFWLNLERANLPFEDNFFDLIICQEVIEHIYSYKGLLTEINRVLGKGGYLLLTTPNLASLSGRIYMLLGYTPTAMISDKSHIRFFRFSNLKSILKEEGFNIIKETTSGVYLLIPKIGFIKLFYLEQIMKALGEHIIILCRK